jgi:CRP-like cAMP-binding protein
MLETLEDITVFTGLTDETRLLVERHFEPFSCRAGTVIFEQGTPATYLYLILSGSVLNRYKPYDGPEMDINTFPAGSAFGWSAVIGEKVYTSSAIAREPVETIRIRGTELRKLVAEHPHSGEELLDRLADLVSQRYKDSHRQVRAILEQALPRS